MPAAHNASHSRGVACGLARLRQELLNLLENSSVGGCSLRPDRPGRRGRSSWR